MKVDIQGQEDETSEVIKQVQGGASIKLSQPISCLSQQDGVYECPFAKKDPITTTTTASEGKEASTLSSSNQVVSGNRKVAAEWKEAVTIFRKLSFNGKTSLVEVKPLHGRTHQIRLHLQHLGHPISNDPCYGGELHYGI